MLNNKFEQVDLYYKVIKVWKTVADKTPNILANKRKQLDIGVIKSLINPILFFSIFPKIF